MDDWIIIKKYLNPITETKYQVKITQIKLKSINEGHILKKKCPRGPKLEAKRAQVQHTTLISTIIKRN